MSNEVVDAVLAQARAQLGTPYGLPPGAGQTDCSLFVVESFRRAGYPFRAGIRTAEQIRLACPAVVASEDGWDNGALAVGDLLFFEATYEGNPGERATHIGFALLDGQMLDANSVHGVGYTDLRSAYWQTHLFECRRPPQYGAASPAPPADRTCEQQLAQERAWGDALLVEIGRWATAIQAAIDAGDAEALAAVINTMRQHAG